MVDKKELSPYDKMVFGINITSKTKRLSDYKKQKEEDDEFEKEDLKLL